ncbi:MAG: hypothetical protein PHW96_01715 [Candidatus Nanoarchaeia archaeon]|nr:hypothetical protein [Candidatus Nanoarchaeia archaeon]
MDLLKPLKEKYPEVYTLLNIALRPERGLYSLNDAYERIERFLPINLSYEELDKLKLTIRSLFTNLLSDIKFEENLPSYRVVDILNNPDTAKKQRAYHNYSLEKKLAFEELISAILRQHKICPFKFKTIEEFITKSRLSP